MVPLTAGAVGSQLVQVALAGIRAIRDFWDEVYMYVWSMAAHAQITELERGELRQHWDNTTPPAPRRST